MHMLIRVVSEAYDAEDATGIAHGLFEGVDAPLYPTFDYGTLMTDGGRWSESLPDIFREEGSARADSEIGNDLLKGAWVSTTRELARRMAVIFLQAGNPAVYRGEERDTVRNNRRSVADRLPTPNATYMNVRFYI